MSLIDDTGNYTAVPTEIQKPLTRDELLKMDGLPIWCIDGAGNECWCLVNTYPVSNEFEAIDSESGQWHGAYYGLRGDGKLGLHNYGWLAFKRQIEY